MRPTSTQSWQISEILISLFVFLILFSYTYALLVLDPYPGFSFNSSNARIVEIYAQPEQGTPTLQVGDILKKIGPILWETYQNDARVILYEGVQAGEIVEITVDRNGETIVVPWKFIGFGPNVLESRLLNMWFLSFFFFLAGATAIILIRPRDLLRNLFVALNYLTALWLIFGMLSHSYIWLSSILLHASTWLLLPIYLHFHWMFPRPLKQLPKALVVFIYFICLCFAVAEFFQVLNKSLYALAFLLALLGSFIIQVIHYRKHEDQRRDIKLLAIAIIIAFLPSIVLGIFVVSGSVPGIAPLALFALPFMPLAYFYAIYRRQMGGLEIRLNRIISLYAFLILIGIALFIIAVLFINLNLPVENLAIIRITIVLVFVFTAITTFPAFQNFVERRFLGINIDTQNLAQSFSNLIVTKTNIEGLLQLLEKDIFPSLLIRQYALVQVENHQLNPLLMKNVSQAQLPKKEALSNLHSMEGKYISNLSPHDDWFRLVLPLKLSDETLGFFLLGSRDPDDIYHQQEIPSLQSIANQTAIALSNIAHAETLREMYKLGLERYEQERLHLAHELHDSVLNQLGDLRRNLGGELSPAIQTSYQEVTDRLREIVSNLRPPMLTVGLGPAIISLAENLMERTGDQIKIKVDLQTIEERLPESIEQHIFRIVQEACENTLKHADAKTIQIYGLLNPQKVDLCIEDDGKGFITNTTFDLEYLLNNNHFGLASIRERAYLIGAQINFQSTFGEGLKINLTWNKT